MNFRRLWHISCTFELIYTSVDVHILFPFCVGTAIPKIPLVEKVHDQITDSKYR